MKGLTLVSVLAAVAIAEPPVENKYLPPHDGVAGYRTTSQDRFSPPSQDRFSPPSQDRFSPPFQSYGAPQRQTDAVFRPRPSSNYGAPSRSTNRRPSAQYGAPGLQSGAPRQAPSVEYGAPQTAQQRGDSFGNPSQQYGAPSQQYGAPSTFGSRQTAGGPSQSGALGQFGTSAQFGGPAPVYGPPGGKGRNGYDGDEEANGEPANYSFEYMVKDEESGNDFGHRETRMGDRAEGLYYVLLPDGRKQTVEYEADSAGYRPKISYEDIGAAAGGGYDGNSQDNGRSSYQNGGSGYQDGGNGYRK